MPTIAAMQTSASFARLVCVRGGSALFRGALAFRRSAAALARANASAVGSAPVPAFPETRSRGRYPLRSVTSLPRSAETGLRAGRAVAQSRPGADGKSASISQTGNRQQTNQAIAKTNKFHYRDEPEPRLFHVACCRKNKVSSKTPNGSRALHATYLRHFEVEIDLGSTLGRKIARRTIPQRAMSCSGV
jgi:hypothetical protein